MGIEGYKFPKDASHGLSYTKMVYNNNKKKPMVFRVDPNSKIFNKHFYFSAGETIAKKHGLCGTATGWHCSCRFCRKT